MPDAARRLCFSQLDVFGGAPLGGNPLAVVHDADGLSDARMAAFARWTNLSETAFLLHPTDPAADYRVRIFTPTTELPFAGHPTLGACHAWLTANAAAATLPREVVQQCGIGRVRLRRDGARLAFEAPPLRAGGPLDDALLERIVRVLGVPRRDVVAHQRLDNGPRWTAVLLGSAAAVRALRPDLAAGAGLEIGVVGPEPAGADTAFEVRAFFPSAHGGLAEDPVTGSLNAGLAQWLIGCGRAPERYVAAQGSALGRAGRVFIDREPPVAGAAGQGAVWVGGDVTGWIEGTVSL